MQLPKVISMPTLKYTILSVIAVAILVTAGGTASARDRNETIDATAYGTGTQEGQNIGVTLNIYEFSTPADRSVLVQAYEKGQSQDCTTHSRR